MGIWIIILVLALLLVLIILLNQRYKKTNYYANQKYGDNQIFDPAEVPNGLQMINVGSVFGRFAFSYDSVKKKCFNFAQCPQSLAYDFRILKQYQENLEEGCIVFITLPIFIFAFVDYSRFKYGRYNNKYYTFMKKENMIYYNPVKKWLFKHLPIVFARKGIFSIVKDQKRENILERELGNLSKQQVLAEANHQLNAWQKQFRIKSYDDIDVITSPKVQDIMNQTTNLLENMINFCMDRGWKPILVTPPIGNALGCKIPDEFVDAYLYENIKKANKRGIPYINFLKHSDFYNYPDLYLNGITLLAKSGREHFMNLLLSKIEQM